MKKLFLLLTLCGMNSLCAFTTKDAGDLTYKQIEKEIGDETTALQERIVKMTPQIQKAMTRLSSTSHAAAQKEWNLLVALATHGLRQKDISKLYLNAIYKAVKGSPQEKRVQDIIDYLDNNNIVLPKALPMDLALKLGFAARL